MAAITAAVIVGGVAIAKGVSGAIKKKKAKEKEKAAQEKLRKMQKDYKNIDTSNPFKDAKNACCSIIASSPVVVTFCKADA